MTSSFRILIGLVVTPAVIAAALCLITNARSNGAPVNQATRNLTFDAPKKIYTTKPGDLSCSLVFLVSNTGNADVAVEDVETTCSCSSVKLPANPWLLRPGESGRLIVEVDLRGKTGILLKQAVLKTSEGPHTLLMQVNIVPPHLDAKMRQENMERATVNPQAVFKDECANCHVIPTFGLTGHALYSAACGICHDAEHRSTMVPDLRSLPNSADRNYWRQIISEGKPGTLMPAFATNKGGPFVSAQIDALADYLVQAFSTGARSAPRTKPPLPSGRE